MNTDRRGDGPIPAQIMLVGEYWGDEEERRGEPFQGASGIELNRILHEAGIMRSECYCSNLLNAKPPYGFEWIAKSKREAAAGRFVPFRDKMVQPEFVAGRERLLREIDFVKPNVIVTFGSLSLLALTGATGILKWRGSQLRLVRPGYTDCPKLIPTVNPAAVLREYSLRPVVLNDVRRAAQERTSRVYANEPKWNFTVRPSAQTVVKTLYELLVLAESENEGIWIDFDLETRAGHIACAGLSWSRQDAICIPFMCVENREGYWTAEEEAGIVYALYRLLTHPRVKVRGQNLLYDAQYTYRHWHFVPHVVQDTMIAHHSVFSGLPKSLAFQASMYCDHYLYWKDDGKTWTKDMGEDQLWSYNCVDCVRTRECGETLATNISSLGLQQVDEFQQKMFWPVLRAMQQGIRVDKKRREQFANELMEEMTAREEYFRYVLGHTLNPGSSKQMLALFYEDLNQQKVMKRGGPGEVSRPTCDDKALETIAKREPILRPLIKKIQEYRSLCVFLRTFVTAPLDIDDRMRTSYNICGTETYRFSSSKNAFGSGTNLQNVPKGGEDDDSALELPNIRKIFVPDFGYTVFDTDLSKADLHIVTWEADEREMKAMLREGRDPYVETAREFYKDPTIKKTRDDGTEHPRYHIFKSFAHGTHYLGTPTGLSQRLGLSVHEAERTQAWYFGKYPRIKIWQNSVIAQVRAKRYVENAFGYRRYYFDRVDDALFRQAIAWIPQSTVALYINRIWMNLYEQYSDLIDVLLQVHDSLVGQFLTARREAGLAAIKSASQIKIPYPDDPLIIPVGVKTSNISWGDCR